MKKRVILMLILLTTLVLPNKNAFAATTSLLDYKTLNYGSSYTSTVLGTTTALTDHNPDTTFTFNTTNKTVWYKFPDGAKLTSYSVIASTTSSAMYIRAYNSSNQTVVNQRIGNYDGTEAAFSLMNPSGGSDITYLEITYSGSGSFTMNELRVYGTNLSVNRTDVTNITVTDITTTVGKVFWDAPIDYSGVNLTGYKVYLDGELKVTLSDAATSYNLSGLSPGTSYNLKVTTTYSDNTETAGIIRSFTTQDLIKNVSNVDVSATYNRVNLSWSLPKQEIFKHVNIYKEKITEEPGFFESIFSLAGTTAYAAGTKIFETNGTYFNDLTVQPDSTYEYTLTSQSSDGQESDGVTVTAETGTEPTPVLKTDGSYTINQDGGYVFTWTEPVIGKVKVLIEGNDYKTVDAALKKITIPKSDMKTNIWGDPKVSMIPVGEYGTEGKEVFIGGNSFIKSLELPFKSSDLLNTSIGILGLVAPIILLVLVIYYSKPIKRVIVNAALKIKERGLKT